jgi:hypothetical protein
VGAGIGAVAAVGVGIDGGDAVVGTAIRTTTGPGSARASGFGLAFRR